MSIKIPVDAKIITEKQLTVVRVVKTLHDAIGKEGGLIDRIKEKMQKMDVDFAQSDHVIARVTQSAGRSRIDTTLAFTALMAKKLTLNDFFACCSVRKEALEKHLSENEIAAISVAPTLPGRSLYTEFKPAIEVDADSLADVLTIPLNRHLGKLAKAA